MTHTLVTEGTISKEKAMAFRVQDAVRVKTGGRLGTVQAVEPFPMGKFSRADAAVLVEFADKRKPGSEWFADYSLELIHRNGDE